MQSDSQSPSQGQTPNNNQTTRLRSPPAKRRRASFNNHHTFNSNGSTTSSARSLSPPPSPSPSPSRSPSPQFQNNSRTFNPPKWFRKPSVVWYRGHDLRVDDHPALLQAAQRGGPVVPLFIWDDQDEFGACLGLVKKWWLKQSLLRLNNDLCRLGVKLYTRKGRSVEQLRTFLSEIGADAVYWNRCYVPSLLQRDEELRIELSHEGFTAESFVSELLVEPWEISSTKTRPCFDTFSDYRRKWKTVRPPPEPFPCPSRLSPLQRTITDVGIQNLGFDVPDSISQSLSKVWIPGSAQAKLQLTKFLHDTFPLFGDERRRKSEFGTSRLSPHIRFGEISPRRMYHATRLRVIQWDSSNCYFLSASKSNSQRPLSRGKNSDDRQSSPPVADMKDQSSKNATTNDPQRDSSSLGSKQTPFSINSHSKSATQFSNKRNGLYKRIGQHQVRISARAFLKNLCLRDFSHHVLFHHPDFNKRPLVPEFNHYPWAKDDGSFEFWKQGKTGYPIIDAAMRELKQTGWIHNGVRFLLACFLTKYLLLPWSKGLEEFYSLLLDGDRSANALGWQWTSGSNSDAFPPSCLVNPVKVGQIYDPTGNYIRRWLPELAKLPTELVHQPWKASSSQLEKANLKLGTNYPNRIISISEARSRAMKAMNFMKRVCATSNIPRSILGKNETFQITEWPDSQSVTIRADDSNNSTGKLSLLPSLWALLQCDQGPTYLSTCGVGSDNLIAMDTASLVEGALAVPLEDQHESIEHALITAHEQVATSGGLSISGGFSVADRYLDVGSFPQAPECETEADMADNSTENVVDIPQFDDQLKYTENHMEVFAEREKGAIEDANGAELADSVGSGGQRSNEMRSAEESRPSSKPTSQAINRGTTVRSTTPVYPYLSNSRSSNPKQQIQQFKQLQQIQVQQQCQEQSREVQPPTSSYIQYNGGIDSSQPPRKKPRSEKLVTNPGTSHTQLPPTSVGRENDQNSKATAAVQNDTSFHRTQETLPYVPPQNSRLGNEFQFAQNPQHFQGAQNILPSHMDQIYSAMGSNIKHSNPIPTGPIMNQSMIGSGNPNTDMKAIQEFSMGESTNSVYHPQLGVSPFYGFQHVLPMVNPHMLNAAERQDVLAAANNRAKVAIPGVLPFGYGMYAGNLFDPNMLGSFPGGSTYAAAPVTSQPQTHVPNHQAQYGMASHPMYFSSPANCNPLHMQANNNIAAQPAEHSGVQLMGMDASQSHMQNGFGTTNSAPGCGNNTEMGVKCAPTANHDAHNNSSDLKVAARGVSNQSEIQNQKTQAQANPSTTGNKSKTKSSSNPKQGTRGRANNRNRRSTNSTGQSRGRGGGKHSSRGRTTELGRSSQSRVMAPRSPTTLKKRQEILSSVLEKTDHEYYGFAKYLSGSYELTGNTDRHTSKDFVRLCNLKDDYHKQCNSEKEKLKIYRIKTFFSEILKLEVTGEWDRHMHGGVRGPYVYGIRIRKPNVSKVASAKG